MTNSIDSASYVEFTAFTCIKSKISVSGLRRNLKDFLKTLPAKFYLCILRSKYLYQIYVDVEFIIILNWTVANKNKKVSES